MLDRETVLELALQKTLIENEILTLKLETANTTIEILMKEKEIKNNE